jgi:hypothetical protein
MRSDRAVRAAGFATESSPAQSLLERVVDSVAAGRTPFKPLRASYDPYQARPRAGCAAANSPPMTRERAAAELVRGAGTQFNPAVVDAFQHLTAGHDPFARRFARVAG